MDPFASQKQESFKAVLPQLKSLARFVLELLNKPHKDTQMEFQHLLLVSVTSEPVFKQKMIPQLCLWGNSVDLSMMASVDSYDASFSQMDSDLKYKSSCCRCPCYIIVLYTGHCTLIFWQTTAMLCGNY